MDVFGPWTILLNNKKKGVDGIQESVKSQESASETLNTKMDFCGYIDYSEFIDFL